MIIHPRWCYFAAPRTASSSIHMALLRLNGTQAVDRHLHANQLPPWVDPSELDAFTVVRDPYTRLASWHKGSTEFQDRPPTAFMEWLLAGDPGRLNPDAMKSQAVFIKNAPTFKTLRILRYEALTDVLPLVGHIDLPHAGKTIWEPWSASDRALVRLHSEEDFEAFGYAK